MGESCPLAYPAISLRKYHTVIYFIIPAVISLMILTVNITLMYALHKTAQYATVSNRLMVILISSDIVTGVFLPPYFAFVSLNIESCAVKKTVEFLFLTSIYFSFNISCCITIDRYIHIRKAQRYPYLMNNFRLAIIAAASFLYAAVNIFALIIIPSFPIVIISSSVSIISLLVMIFLNWSMKVALRSHQAKMTQTASAVTIDAGNRSTLSSGNTEDSASSSTKESTKRKVQAVETIKHLLTSLIVLYVPMEVINIVFAYIVFETASLPSLELMFVLAFAAFMFVSNSWVSALIIIRGNTRCRAYISSHLLPRVWRRNTRRVDKGRVSLVSSMAPTRIVVTEQAEKKADETEVA